MSDAADSQFWALYLTRFAEGVGFITLITLLPTYVSGAFAVTGVVTLLGLLAHEHGRGSLLRDYADEQQSADDQQQQRYLRPRTIDALVAVSQHPHDHVATPCRAFGAGLPVLRAAVLSHESVGR